VATRATRRRSAVDSLAIDQVNTQMSMHSVVSPMISIINTFRARTCGLAVIPTKRANSSSRPKRESGYGDRGREERRRLENQFALSTVSMAREIGQSALLNTRFTLQDPHRRVNDQEPYMDAKRLIRRSYNYLLACLPQSF
jgi:hypothetical protein